MTNTGHRLRFSVCALALTALAGTPVSALAAAPDEIFDTDAGTLAKFELNGAVTDSSGNHRDAILLGGVFVPTQFGQGLQLTADPQGFDWSAFAGLLHHPYTMEFAFTPTDSSTYHKLFGFDDSADAGFYVHFQAFEPYDHGNLGDIGSILANARTYLALLSTDSSHVDVYINGSFAGNAPSGGIVTGTQTQAIFFRDDAATGRGERFGGVVDAVRLSGVSRSAAEIQAVAARIFASCDAFIAANPGVNIVRGTEGNDNLVGLSNVKNAILGGGGNDILTAGPLGDCLDGGEGNDHLIGGAGADLLFGGNGTDWLEGRGDNDQLFGGAGSDRLDGGSGSDTCHDATSGNQFISCEVIAP